MKRIDEFGASDAWGMFALWALASGHTGAAVAAFVICLVICILPDEVTAGGMSGSRTINVGGRQGRGDPPAASYRGRPL